MSLAIIYNGNVFWLQGQQVFVNLCDLRNQRPIDYLNLRVLGYQQYIPSIEEMEEALKSMEQTVLFFNKLFPNIYCFYRYLLERGKRLPFIYGIVDALDEWLIAFADNMWKTTSSSSFFGAETQSRLMRVLLMRNKLLQDAAQVEEAIIKSNRIFT